VGVNWEGEREWWNNKGLVRSTEFKWPRNQCFTPVRRVIGRNRQLPVTVSVTGAELWAGMAELIDR